MRESMKPSDDELEEAFSVALSRPNTFLSSYETALEAEDDLNECLEDVDLTSEEAQECMDEITEELNDEFDYVDASLEVSGMIKQRTINHRLVMKGVPIPESAAIDSWANVTNHKVTSLGFIALLDGKADRPATIYHASCSDGLHTVAFDSRYGAVYIKDRIFIPIDGSVHVELSGPEEPKWELLDYYLSDDLLDSIDSTFEQVNLTDSLHHLHSIDLSQSTSIMDRKADPEIRRALVDYINHGLGINDRNNIIYQIIGGQAVFVKDPSEKWEIQNLDGSSIFFGTVESVVVDQKSGKFHLLAKLPFDDNSKKHVIFQLHNGFQLIELPSLSLKRPRKKKR
jgi:hypothetical protein